MGQEFFTGGSLFVENGRCRSNLCWRGCITRPGNNNPSDPSMVDLDSDDGTEIGIVICHYLYLLIKH